MPPQIDLSGHERYGDINGLIAYLQSIELDEHVLCIYQDNSACGFKVTAHKKHNRRFLFKDAGATLSKNYESVETSEFISVLRILFCSTHDLGNRSKEWEDHRDHLATFWNKKVERKLRRELWKALGECHARIKDWDSTTPQKERLDLNRGFSSVPRDISRPAENRRLKAELAENARASTVQGNPGREVSFQDSGADTTPSKPPRVSNQPRKKATTKIKREHSDDESHCESSSDEECSNGRRSSTEPSDQEPSDQKPSDYGTDADYSCNGNTCDDGGTTTGGGLFSSGGTSSNTFGGGFGSTNNTSTSAFGSTSNTTSGGLFAQNKPAGFGSTSNTTSSGLFAENKPTGFGSTSNTTSGGLFAENKPTGFGSTSNTTSGGLFAENKPTGFGSTSNTTSGGLFAENKPTGFGSTSNTTSGGLFAQNKPAGFGSTSNTTSDGLFGGGNTSGGFGTNATSGGFGSATTGPKHLTKPVEVNHFSRSIPYRFVGTSQASSEVKDGQPAPFANGPDASESQDDGSSPSKRVHPEASGIKLFSPVIQRSLFTFSNPIAPARESAPLFQAGYGGSPRQHTRPYHDEFAKFIRVYKERTEGVSAYQENSTTSPENTLVPLTQAHVPENTLFISRTPMPFREQSRELTPFSSIQRRGTLFQTPPAAPLSTFTNPPRPETPSSQRVIPPPITPSPQPVHDSSPLTPAPYNPQDIVAQIRKHLKKDLTSSMYILSAPSFFSTTFTPTRTTGETWVKIGYSVDVRERVKEISSKCGIPNLRAVYQSPHRIRTDVLRVIEAVCHEQLINFRRTMDCDRYGLSDKCTQMHKEWFAVPTEVAKRTVEMWEGFARRYPYAQDGELETPWARSLKGFTLREQGEGEDEGDMLHESFQAWITTTGLASRSSRDGD